jgi:hypothetical protein
MKKLTTLILMVLICGTVRGQYEKITLTGAYSQIRFEPTGLSNYYLGTKAQDKMALGLYGGKEKSWLTYWKEETGDMIIKKGKVGIGTASPQSPLHINSPAISGGESAIKIKVSDSANDYLEIRNATGASHQFIPFIGGYRESDNRVVLGLSAKVPAANDVGNDAMVIFDARRPEGPIINRSLFSWGSYTSKYMTMSAKGYLGIGTTTPSAKLDVNGNIKAHEIEVTLASIDDMQLNGTLAANNITYTANGNTADFVFEDNYQLKDLAEVEAFILTNKHLPEVPSAAEMEETGVNLAEMNKLLLMKVEELTLYTIELEKKMKNVKQKEKQSKGEQQRLENRVEKLEEMLATLLQKLE